MFSKFSEEAQKVLLNAKKEMMALKHPYVGSEHLLLAILSDKEGDVSQKLEEFNINYEMFKKELIKIVGKGNISNNWFLYTPLLKRIIEASTNEGDLILDPFNGSGTTGLAAVILNRKYIGLEQEEEYLELSKRRYEKLRGL